MVTRAKAIEQREHLIFLAGLFEGEGCISVGKGRVPGRRPAFQVVCSLGMTHLPSVMKFHTFFGGNVYRRLERNTKVRQAWDWRLSSSKAAAAITQMLPWLDAKRPGAVLAIELQSLIGQNSPGRLYRIPEENYKRREEIYWAMREINSRLPRAETKREDPVINDG